MSEKKLEVVCVLATDWCYYEQTRSIHDKFTPIDGYIVGFVQEEDDEKIVLCHQVFPDNESVRHVTVVTKSSIIELARMRIKDPNEEEEVEDLQIEDE